LQGQRWRASYARWLLVTILCKKGPVGCYGNREALCLDVIVGVAGIRKRFASGAAQPVRVSKIVAAECICGVTTVRL
jgi:hypothetical protein